MTEQSRKATRYGAVFLAGSVFAFGLVNSAVNQASGNPPGSFADEANQNATVRGTRADYAAASKQSGELTDIGDRRGTRTNLVELDALQLNGTTVATAPRRGTR